MVASIKIVLGVLAFGSGLAVAQGPALAGSAREPGLCKENCTSFLDLFAGQGAAAPQATDKSTTSSIRQGPAPATAQPTPTAPPARPSLFAPPTAAAQTAAPAAAGPAASFLDLFAPAPSAAVPPAEPAAEAEARPERATRRIKRPARTRAARSGRPPATPQAPRILGLAMDVSGALGDDILKAANTPVDVDRSGSAATVKDFLAKREADLAVMSTVALRRGLADRGAAKRLAVVAKLFTEELHVVARSDVAAIQSLDGQRVAVGAPGSTSALAADDAFAALGIKPTIVHASPEDAVKQLQAGDIAAALFVAGKPFATLADIPEQDGLKLLAVPFAAGLAADYYPATIAAQTYPELIAADERIDTIAVGTVLVARQKPGDARRDQRIADFVERFFEEVETLAASGHPKWREVNLAAAVPGVAQIKPAQKWLTARPQPERDKPISSARAAESASR